MDSSSGKIRSDLDFNLGLLCIKMPEMWMFRLNWDFSAEERKQILGLFNDAMQGKNYKLSPPQNIHKDFSKVCHPTFHI